MGFFDRFRKSLSSGLSTDSGQGQLTAPSMRAAWAPPRVTAAEGPTIPRGGLVMVVGESHYQDALAEITGGRRLAGHTQPCVAVLLPEPTNPYDPAAVMVTVCGKCVGYLSRGDARGFRDVIDAAISGSGEARVDACITGGWDRGRDDRGSFGVDLYFASGSNEALPFRVGNTIEPARDDEIRLRGVATVSVSHEEHYQEALSAAVKGTDLTQSTYPVLAELVEVSANPHAKKDRGSAIEVRVEGATVGYLTPAMTARFVRVVQRSRNEGKRLTCTASVFEGVKAGVSIKEIRLSACPHAEDEVKVIDPYFEINTDLVQGRTRTVHRIREQVVDGSFKTLCGHVIKANEATLYASTKPWLGDLDPMTHEFVAPLPHCERC